MNVIIDNGKYIFKDDVQVIIEDDKITVQPFHEKQVKLSELNPKDVFKIGDEEFIVLEQSDDNTTKVISKQFAYSEMKFGDNANWKQSPIRTLLNNEYYKRISDLVGANNIISMQRDLTSLDGLDDYGTCTDKITLLSANEYAKYHKILGLKSNYSDWWWTITPVSTPSNNYARDVCYVRSNGILSWFVCGYCRGVRPFFCLDSSVMIQA